MRKRERSGLFILFGLISSFQVAREAFSISLAVAGTLVAVLVLVTGVLSYGLIERSKERVGREM